MAATFSEVKAVIEDREGAYNLYWNGKTYGTKVYLTLTRQRSGSQKKVTFDTGTQRIDSNDLDLARKALRQLSEAGIKPFNGFEF